MNTKIFVSEDKGGHAVALYEALAGMIHLGATANLRQGYLVEMDSFYAPVIERLIGLSGVSAMPVLDVTGAVEDTFGEWQPGPNEWTQAGDPAREQAAVVIDPGDPERGVSELPAEITLVQNGDLPQCEFCGEVFKPKTKRSRFCDKPDCKKAYARNWRRENRGKSNGKAAAKPEPESEPVAAPPQPEPDPAPVEDQAPIERAEAVDAIKFPWLIEDGPRAGKRLTSVQLRRLLVEGNMKTGQHLRHVENGQHRVVKGPYPGQKLERTFGDGAPFYILPGEV